jgi:hypothetical protein
MKPRRGVRPAVDLQERRAFLGILSGAVASLTRAQAHAKSAEPRSQVPRIRNAKDGSPIIKIYNSTWALRGLPRGGKEWSLEEKLTRLKDAGFEGIETEDLLENEQHSVGLIRKLGLGLGMGSSKILRSAQEVREGLEVCKRTGARLSVAKSPLPGIRALRIEELPGS